MRLNALLATVALSAAAVLGSSQAQATILFTDNFDAEHGGTSALNYTGFSNFSVVSGAVDLVASGNYGITCAGGGGSCVDLNGTPGSGVIESKLVNFSAGETITLSFDLAQNQRISASDTFFANIDFTGATQIASSSLGGGFGSSTGPNGSLTSLTAGGTVTNAGFTTYTLTFTPDQDGSFNAVFGTKDQGYIGALLDNVSILDVSSIPEPNTWAMVLIGFFGLGAMVRLSNRRAQQAV